MNSSKPVRATVYIFSVTCSTSSLLAPDPMKQKPKSNSPGKHGLARHKAPSS